MPQVLTDPALRRLLDAGRAVVSELDVQAVLDRVLATAAEVTGARYAALGILDERRTELERFLTHGIPEAAHRAIGELPRGRGILGAVIADPRPLRLDSVSADPRSFGFPAGHPPMETFLGVPVMIRGEAWGNLYLCEKAGGEPFTRRGRGSGRGARGMGCDSDRERSSLPGQRAAPLGARARRASPGGDDHDRPRARRRD